MERAKCPECGASLKTEKKKVPDACPPPAVVKAAMDAISTKVQDVNETVTRVAREYCVVGDVIPAPGPIGLDFRVTKDGGGKWGVYVRDGDDLRLVTGVRVDWKIAFLRIADRVLPEYLSKCAWVVNTAADLAAENLRLP